MALFYNKDMFAAANLQPPTTWAEIESDAAALTKNGVYGIAWSSTAGEEGSWQFEPWFWGAGADLTKLDSPQAVKALQSKPTWLIRATLPSLLSSGAKVT